MEFSVLTSFLGNWATLAVFGSQKQLLPQTARSLTTLFHHCRVLHMEQGKTMTALAVMVPTWLTLMASHGAVG